jgi:hypothetical protein
VDRIIPTQYDQHTVKKFLELNNLSEPSNYQVIEKNTRDTFVRITKDASGSTQRVFFRRKKIAFNCNTFNGVFIIELYRFCDEDDLPILHTYQSCNMSINLYKFNISHIDPKISVNVCVSILDVDCEASKIKKHSIVIRSDIQSNDFDNDAAVVNYIESFMNIIKHIKFETLDK